MATSATRSDEGSSEVHVAVQASSLQVCSMSDEAPFNIEEKFANEHRIPGDSPPSEARGKELTSLPPLVHVSPPPLMHVMKYMVPSLLVLITLKYQAKTTELFQENPAPVWCFIAATGVYWLIVGRIKQTTTLNNKWSEIAIRAALASAVLSAVSLISIFITYPVSLVPLMIWMLLPVVLAWPILRNAYGSLKRGINCVVNKIQTWVRGLNSMEEAPNLPVSENYFGAYIMFAAAVPCSLGNKISS